MTSGSAGPGILPPTVGWTLLIGLGALWVVLGVFWGRKAKNMDGFMVAGRNVGLALGTATAMATWVTSNTTMIAPEFALKLGVWGMLAYSTACIGLFLFAPMARRIRRLMPSGLTSGDFVRLRYGSTAWTIFLIITITYSFAWLVTMAMAGGLLMEVIAEIPYQWGMTMILGVCVLYTVFGGMYAVIGTDFVQSVIILVGVVVVGVLVYWSIDFSTTYAEVLTERPAMLYILLPGAIIAFFNNMLFGLGEVFHNNVWWSRAFALRKDATFKAYTLAGLFWLPIPIAVGYVAFSSGTLGINIPSPEMLGPLVAESVLGAAGGIAVFIVLFCSLASSIDSLLAATADLLTEDIYRKGFRRNSGERELRIASVFMILGLGFMAWVVSLKQLGTLVEVLFASGPLVGSVIWPIAAGLFWRQTNRRGVVWAMILGSALGLTAYYQIGWYSGALVGAAVSMIITVVSTWAYPNEFKWRALDESASHLTKRAGAS